MSWRVDAQAVNFAAGQGFAAVNNTIGNVFSSFLTGATNSIGSLFRGYDVIGINGAEIPKMRDAIRTYITELNKHLDEIVTSTNPEMFVKGAVVGTIKDYVATVAETCKEIISELLKFSDELVKIEEAYNKHAEEQAKTIVADTNKLAAEKTAYQEQF